MFSEFYLKNSPRCGFLKIYVITTTRILEVLTAVFCKRHIKSQEYFKQLLGPVFILQLFSSS